MSAERLITNYGLLAVFLGGILEGESILILAAIAVHGGLLQLPSVYILAATGAIIGDQLWFLLARYRPKLKFVQKIVAKPKVRRALDLIEHYPTLFILSFRFIYGLRTAGAVGCGISNVPVLRFAILNVLAALIWTAVILAIGYVFGSTIQLFLHDFKQIEWKLLAAAIVMALVYFTVWRYRKTT